MLAQPIFSLSKKELLARLAHLDDDGKIYIHTKKEDALAAIAAARPDSNEVYFGLTRETVVEPPNGLSLVAYFPK